MNHEHLKTFVTVTELKSFSKAAEALHLSQPTITSHIKQLENELEVTLFKRSTKQLSLTPAAHLLYPYAIKIIKLNQQAKQELSSFTLRSQNRLNLACSFIVGETILPPLFQLIKKEHPQLMLHVELLPPNLIIRRLKTQLLDVAILEQTPAADQELRSDQIGSDQLIFTCTPSYFPKPKAAITLTDLHETPLILPTSQSPIRILIDQILAKKNMNHYNLILESDHLPVIKAAITAGWGGAILPRAAIQDDLYINKLAAYPITDLPLNVDYYLIYYDQPAHPLVRNVLNILRNLVNSNQI